MPSINIGSDLLEAEFTPVELNTAMQFKDTHLSLVYLQNKRVAYFRQIVALDYTPALREESIQQQTFLRGCIHVLDELLLGVLEPTPVAPDGQEQSPQPHFPGDN